MDRLGLARSYVAPRDLVATWPRTVHYQADREVPEAKRGMCQAVVDDGSLWAAGANNRIPVGPGRRGQSDMRSLDAN